MFNKIKSMFKADSEAISAAKALPTAYRDMLGFNFMVCEDREDFDWSGLGAPIALAEIKNADNDTGSFGFFFIIPDEVDEYSFDRFKCQMTVTQTDNGYSFSSEGESVNVQSPVTAENLKPVLEMALKHKQQVGMQD